MVLIIDVEYTIHILINYLHTMYALVWEVFLEFKLLFY